MCLTDAKDVMEAIQDVEGASFPVLTPNLKGFEAAVAAGAKEVAIFPAASESFSKRNLNCSIEDSLIRCRDVARAAKKLSILFVGTVIPMLKAVINVVPFDMIAVHFHDIYGQALSNTLVSLQAGISTVDSSVSGLGGCPYAKGATGNVATEDVVYMLNGLGVRTNVDLEKLIMAGEFISNHLGRSSGSKAATALRKVPSCSSKL
ncbi:hydroxymethylglutaryl-CoA lyase, mitochondrial-like isoform X2 [Humulus lupulus]|uniref:hydroxymethylglutaryl-CoA lyase, mitochondrial-like isoform X2 n=1 Tax=Humulus lupulus TaxID=3486 RepID=UPI002B407EB8|nr:hydroxymethylglutaryl-CoA lyase, mitochondrial-like isoform X2 [Humulus lupulus]